MNLSNYSIKSNVPFAVRKSRNFRYKTSALLLLICLAVGGTETKLEQTRADAITAPHGKTSVINAPVAFYFHHRQWRADARSVASVVQYLLAA